MKKKRKLRREISRFRKKKGGIAILLLILGVLGLILPVIPGLVFIALGCLFLFPKSSEKFLTWIGWNEKKNFE